MDVDLPNFEGQEQNTLYFIGNGFDLFHGLKTKFIHFYSWLNLEDEEHEQFVTNIEELFYSTGIHGNKLWSNFEEALGKVDVDYIHESFSGEEVDKFGDEDFQIRAAQYFSHVTKKIPQYLWEWIGNTKISKATFHPSLHLNKHSKYLTFNYTTLLEERYDIPEIQINHIHGSYKKPPLITGHGNYLPEKTEDPHSWNIEQSWKNIINEAKRLRKNVSEIISQNKAYFDSLENISNVIVFGHSLSQIDRPYFEEVIHHVKDGTNWYFVYYNEDDRKKYDRLIGRYAPYQRKKIRQELCNFIQITN
jgi:hypothetical protein